MHSVQLHEIIFSFTFVWPFSIIFSFLVVYQKKRLRIWHILAIVITGPAGTLAILWKQFVGALKTSGGEIPSSEKPPPPDRFLRILGYALYLCLAYLFLTGLLIFLHPGWTRFYFALIKGHSLIGYFAWFIFLVYLFKHARHYYESMRGAVLLFLFIALLTAMVHTLNMVCPLHHFLINIPLFYIAWLLGRVLKRPLSDTVTPLAHKTGLALTIIVTMTFATGAYIAEPLNSSLNNNMGLYVIYFHGAVPMILLPWLVGMGVHHIWPRMQAKRKRKIWSAVMYCLPVYILLFAGLSLYSHWKWYGLDAGPHYWPPSFVRAVYAEARKYRETFATHTGPPPPTEKCTFPRGYERVLTDYTVCSQPTCHPNLVEEWKYSPHRFAASNLFFRKVIERLVEDTGSRELNYFCLNCHDPALVLHPDREKGIPLERLKSSDGITCKACHTMVQGARTVRPWDGFYELRPETPYPVKITDPDYLTRWPDFIRWDLRLHLKNYSIPDLSLTSELCASCHVASMPAFVTGLKEDMKAADLYTSWKNSPYAKKGQTCVTCHMPNRSFDVRGFEYPDHRTPGLNTGITLMVEGDEETLRGVRKFEDFTRELAKGNTSWPDAIPFLSMKIETPETVRPGSTLPVIVKTTNTRVGHYFHAGPSSLNEVWLELIVTDASGGEIYHSGGLSEGRRLLDPAAHRLGARILDAEGEMIQDCSIWNLAEVQSARRIDPFETVEDRYDIFIPARVQPPLTVRARWNHRRASQAFMDWVYDGKAPPLPVVELASADRMVNPAPAARDAAATMQTP